MGSCRRRVGADRRRAAARSGRAASPVTSRSSACRDRHRADRCHCALRRSCAQVVHLAGSAMAPGAARPSGRGSSPPQAADHRGRSRGRAAAPPRGETPRCADPRLPDRGARLPAAGAPRSRLRGAGRRGPRRFAGVRWHALAARRVGALLRAPDPGVAWRGRAGDRGARGRPRRLDRMAPVITSAANPRLKLVRKLASARQRHKLGLFVVEGEDLVEAGLAAGLEPVELLVAGENVSAEVLSSVSGLPHPSRRIAVFRRDDLPRITSVRVSDTGIALWQVGDPGNVGTILRSADALGAAFVALSAGCADPTGPKAVRASMGALFRVPLISFDDAPRPWIGLAARGGAPLADLDLHEGTFVLGAEREGLPEAVLARCDQLATISIVDHAESLNVAMAGTIALYELARRRSSS